MFAHGQTPLLEERAIGGPTAIAEPPVGSRMLDAAERRAGPRIRCAPSLTFQSSGGIRSGAWVPRGRT